MRNEMGLNTILFYFWFVFTLTVLFCALIWILELVFPKCEEFIKKFKNYFKGGVL